MNITGAHFYINVYMFLKFFTEPNSYLMRLLDGLKYGAMPHFWMVFIWTKLIAFQNKITPNLWQATPPRHPQQNPIERKRIMEYFFKVLNDSDQEKLIRAQGILIIYLR